MIMRQWLTAERRRVLYACGAAILLFVIGNLLRPGFASVNSVEAVLVVASFVGLVAAGQTFVILIGGIDLSVPWILNAAAILLVTSSLGENVRAPYALLLTLGMGALAGAVNGLGIALLRRAGRGHDPCHERHHAGPHAWFERRPDLCRLCLLRAAFDPAGRA